MKQSAAKHHPTPSMRLFFTFWAGQAVSLFGSQVVGFAIAWHLATLTGTATTLATGVSAMLIPHVIIGPFAGALVDRWNRRIVMLAADGAIAALTLALAYLFLAGSVETWHIYAVLFLRAVGEVFHFAAEQASLALLVPEDRLARISGLNQATRGAISITAPILGGLLIGLMPMQAILTIDVLTAAVAMIILLLIAIPQPASAPSAAGGAVLADVVAGLRYVWSWPGLTILIVLATLLNLTLNPAFYLMPILITRYFQGQAIHQSWMEAAFGIGLVIGGIALGAWGGFKRKVVTLAVGLIVLGLLTLAIGFLPQNGLLLCIGLSLLVGGSVSMLDGSFMAVLQTVVDHDKQGRVFTLVGAGSRLLTPLGLAIGSNIADAFGAQWMFVAAGISTTLLGVAASLIPAVLALEDGRAMEVDVVEADALEVAPAER